MFSLFIHLAAAMSLFEKPLQKKKPFNKHFKKKHKLPNYLIGNSISSYQTIIPNVDNFLSFKNSNDTEKLNLRKEKKRDFENKNVEKNFLQLHSKSIYDPSLFFRNSHNSTIGISTIYYSRLVWVCFLFLVIFLMICSVGVYLYVENLKYTPMQKKRLANSSAHHYISSRHGQYLQP